MASADSMRARIFKGLGEEGACRWGRVWRIMSVMKWRSEARFTLGITRASRLGAWRIVVKSSRARPEETLFMRLGLLVGFGWRN